MSKSTFVSDLTARIRDAERVIADQNEHLTALRLLLRKEMGEEVPAAVTPAPIPAAPEPSEHPGVNFKARTWEIIFALVQESGEKGTRPRDIAEILLKRKLITKGSNSVHSHLSDLKKRGLVRQKAEGLYVAGSKPASAKPAAAAPVAAPKTHLSPAGREAIRKAQQARWATAKKATPAPKAVVKK